MKWNSEPGAGLGLHDVDGVSHHVSPRHTGNVGAALSSVKV
jgi:hypothetical protein